MICKQAKKVLVWILLTESMLILTTRLGAFLHEFVGHGLMAMLLGGRFESFRLTLFAGGEALFSGNFGKTAYCPGIPGRYFGQSHHWPDCPQAGPNPADVLFFYAFLPALCRSEHPEPIAVYDSGSLLPIQRPGLPGCLSSLDPVSGLDLRITGPGLSFPS